MKLHELKISGYRGLDFTYDFSNDPYVVLTGVNGSGKSTILEVLDYLLLKRAREFDAQSAQQITEDEAVFEVTVSASEDEVKALAAKIALITNNYADSKEIKKQLDDQVFKSGKLKRQISIKKYEISWNNEKGGYISESINDSAKGFELEQSIQNILGNEMSVMFLDIKQINLSYNKGGVRRYHLSSVFSTDKENKGFRKYSTNVQANAYFQSLLKFENPEEDTIKDLLINFGAVLSDLDFDLKDEENGNTQIVLKNSNGNIHGINTASSGQKKAIAFELLKHIWPRLEVKPILLIDEPENSLHPALTKAIFESFSELSEEQNNTIIIATHSPEIVATNPRNTFRIISDATGKSELGKIEGLEDRATIVKELGMFFSIDYVAQKIVFVESESKRTSGRISDAEAYQELIDPRKESVLFLSAGSKKSTSKTTDKFNEVLHDELKVKNSELVSKLVDLDEEKYDKSKHTPFKCIEYVFLSSHEAISSVSNLIPAAKTKTSKEVSLFVASKNKPKTSKDYKTLWQQLMSELGLKGKGIGVFEKNVMKELRMNEKMQDKLVKQLVLQYS